MGDFIPDKKIEASIKNILEEFNSNEQHNLKHIKQQISTMYFDCKVH